MAEKQLITQSTNKTLYRDGDKVYKVFEPAIPKSEVFNEALNTARVEETGLDIGMILGVSMIDGKWALTKEYVEGKTMAELMKEDPKHIQKYIDMMVELQIMINSKKCPLLNRLKEKIIRQIESLDMLSEVTKYELLTRLDGMPKHLKLCHGDFQPSNIIVQEDKLYVIDWVHAAQGNASADVARTYLLLALEKPLLADMYMDTYCEKTNTGKNYVQRWLPIVAAAQLEKRRPGEKELLMKWTDVCEYQ